MRTFATYFSSICELYIISENGYIVAIHLGKEDFTSSENAEQITYDPKKPELTKAIQQLNEYFSGERKIFELPLKEEGTPFQRAVWTELKEIPFGQTRSYQEIAIAIGKEKAVRAIGQANKANKLPIIIPCHRVIGKDKRLTGYAGKRINIKEKLLTMEGAAFKNEISI